MSDLTICKLSDCSATVAGGREIILLCEKVAKEDIQVRFYEEVDGDVMWDAQGDFTPTHVHKQVAITFRTPKYRDLDVDKPVRVWVQLRRPSDGATSESIPFVLQPLDSGRPAFWSLHRALAKKGDYGTFSDILTVEAQKRKLEAVSPESESKKQKDSLISGGGLVTLPPPVTVYDEQPKVLGLELTKPNLTLVEEPDKLESGEPEPEPIAMQVDDKSKDDSSFENYVGKEKDSLSELMDNANENSFEGLIDKSKESSLDGLLTKTKDENSFDDLITQVAELDEIYSEARTRLQLEDAPMPMHCPELFDDSQTYTSLQLAMKNPIEVGGAYEDMVPVESPVIAVGRGLSGSGPTDDKLPPLPPKRVKQTPPGRPDTSPPSRDLPRTPDGSKPPKGTLFSKLFSKKKSDKSLKRHSISSESLKLDRSKSSLEDISSKNNEKGFTKWFHRGSTGSLTETPSPLPAESEADIAAKENIENLELDLDLTEAENYALYTATAPHATASEFDEMSSYYSPVEGGRILRDFRPKPQNVSS